MSAPKEDPIEAILNSPLKEVLVKGFAELYKQRPAFPVEYFGKWLKNYSHGQQKQKELESTRTQKQEKVTQLQRIVKQKIQKENQMKLKKVQKINRQEEQFKTHLNKTSYPIDLLAQYLPSEIERSCQQRGIELTGCYVGELKHRHKKLEEHNFQQGAELDTQNPKIVQYIGATKSHHFMIGQILPNETGKSYEVFKQQQPVAEEQQENKAAKPKKKYLYIPQVQRDEKIYHFRYPKLGCYACFPLKIKSCLYSTTFDKAIGDYKAFVKNKEQVEKEYHQKLSDAKSAFQQAKRKYEQHEGNQQDPQFQADHANLHQEFTKSQQAFRQVESTPPNIQPFNYDTKMKEYLIGIDTMGLDSQVSEEILNHLQKKIDNFKLQWQEKEYKMLLDDVLLYLEQEGSLEGLDTYFKDQEKGFIGSNESQIKEQFPNKQKEAEYELTLLKVGKFLKIMQQQPYLNSMHAYLTYHLPKYTEVIQIALMILGHKKNDINVSRSNILNHRKSIQKAFIEKMLADLQKYELRRDSSDNVENEYKINKLLQRLQKVDGQGVGRYNSWLFAFLCTLKQICWARIQCRDAKIQAYEAKLKAKNDRDTEITKYEQQMDKALQAAKAELNEETLPTFVEEDWRKTYSAQNVKPEPLAINELKQFLDIE